MMGKRRNGNGGRPLAASGFEEMIAEAVGLDAEVAAMNADRALWRLSKPAFRAKAMELAGVNAKTLVEIKKRIASDPGLSRDLSAACRELSRRIVDGHCNGPDRRVANYHAEKAGAATPLASIGHRPELLWCLVVDDIDDEAFGTATDLAAVDAAFEARRARLLVLKSKLERGWTADDVLIEPCEGEEAEARGYCRVSFRCLPEVTLGRDVSSRLITAYRKQAKAESERRATPADVSKITREMLHEGAPA